MTAVVVAIIAVVAFAVRILPLRWGAYLSEFDPYWHYYVAQRVVDQGFFSVYGWVDQRTWYPFGRVVDVSTPMGLPYTVAVFYHTVHAIGVPATVLDVSIFTPPFMAALTTIAIYFLGKDIGGREVGLLSSLFLGLNGAYISRTSLGFLKHETVGVFAIVIALFFFLRAIDEKRTQNKSILYSIFAALSVGYLNMSWGAYLFLVGLIPLLAVILVFMRRYSPRLFIAYTITMGLSLAITVPFPRTGLFILTSAGTLPVIGAFVVLFIAEIISHIQTNRGKIIFISLLAVIGGVAIFGLTQLPTFSSLPGKLLSVANPALRSSLAGPIVESVAEHRISTWAIFYLEFGNLVIFAPLGILFALRKRRTVDVAIVLAGLLSLYFGSSFVRLTLVMAPIFAALAAYGFIELARPFVRIIRGGIGIPKTRFSARLGIAFILIMAAVMVPTFIKAVDAADAPVTIASSSAPLREFRGDWLEALKWIRENVPPGEPVVSWWDYGYWIAIGGNSTSVADNATLNTTQIANIGQILLSNESIAFDLSKKYFGSKYIVVYVTTAPTSQGPRPWGFGDEGKWVFMADIAHGFHPEISRLSVDKDGNGIPDQNTLMGKAVFYSINFPVNFTKSEVAFVSSSHADINVKPTTQVIIFKAKE